MPAHRKSGAAKARDFEGENLRKLDALAEALHKRFPDSQVDRQSAAKLTVQLIDFSELVAGKEAPHQPPFLRIPLKLFHDFRPNGALATILSKCIEFKAEQDVRRIDFQSPARRDSLIILLQRIHKELEAKGFLRPPKIYFTPGAAGEEFERLKDFVLKQAGAEFAASESERGVSHILYLDPPAEPDANPDSEWIRTLEVQGNFARVHWWYYPDSYDEWLPLGDVEGEAEEETQHKGPWHLHLRWLRDSCLYNEWMNELDYVLEEKEVTKKGASGAARNSRSRSRRKHSQDEGDEAVLPTTTETAGEEAGGRKGKRGQEGELDGGAPADRDNGGSAGVGADVEQGKRRKRSAEDEGVAEGDDQPPALKLRLTKRGDDYTVAKQFDVGTEAAAAVAAEQNGLASPLPGKRKKQLPPGGTPAPKEPPVPLGPDGKPVEVLPGRAEQVNDVPRVSRQQIGQPHASVLAAIDARVAVNGSQHGAPKPPVPSPTPHSAPQQEGGTPSKPTTPEVHRVPSHAGWFSWTRIHPLERRHLPEFFEGQSQSKTPELYMEYRNFIIKKYREDPLRQLTFTEVRRMLVGDVGMLGRVFDFLSHWGMINYQATGESRQRGLPWAGEPAALVETGPAGVRAVVPTIVGTGPALYHFADPRQPHTGAHEQTLATHRSAYAPASAEAAVQQAAQAVRGRVADYFCDACGAECTSSRYHCRIQPNVDLCPGCYADGRLGPGLASTDFTHKGPAPEESGGGGMIEDWSEQETLLLLEGLELYGDSWTEVAEHVVTKTKAQCILHFIRLPIEDPFLEELETTNSGAPQPVSSATQAPDISSDFREDKRDEGETLVADVSSITSELTPFADAGNPIMAQVAFLAAMVGPRVAAAAAQAALEALTEEYPENELRIHDGQSAPGAGAAAQAERGPDVGSAPTTAAETTEQQAGAPATASASQDGVLTAGVMDGPTSALRLRVAAATGLAAAAVKAKLLADAEEREIQRLVAEVMEQQVKKLELKLRHFEDLEDLLLKERDQVERTRQHLIAERHIDPWPAAAAGHTLPESLICFDAQHRAENAKLAASLGRLCSSGLLNTRITRYKHHACWRFSDLLTAVTGSQSTEERYAIMLPILEMCVPNQDSEFSLRYTRCVQLFRLSPSCLQSKSAASDMQSLIIQ
eukprot:SM000036S13259  [mRNA]  locus=s36:210416:217077:+ [translate_table: standard]